MRMSKVNFLSKEKPVVVKPDLGVNGKQVGNGFEFSQGDDYVIADALLVNHLLDEGFTVEGELGERAAAIRRCFS